MQAGPRHCRFLPTAWTFRAGDRNLKDSLLTHNRCDFYFDKQFRADQRFYFHHTCGRWVYAALDALAFNLTEMSMPKLPGEF